MFDDSRSVKRTNCLPCPRELSYGCLRLQAPYSSLSSHCRNPAASRAKSPAAVATDVAAARQQASTEVKDARTDAARDVDSAAANADGSKDLNDVGARTEYDVAVAQADGDHNVAIQQCLALTGEAQKSCKERADADYDRAKTHANVTRLSKLQ